VDDVKFVYMIFRRKSPEVCASVAPWSRVLQVPMKRGGHVVFDACHSDGKSHRLVATRSQGKELYKLARGLRWGDRWPFPAKASMKND
jgi:ribosomal protein RSM22 (predicted rRNA methylase)